MSEPARVYVYQADQKALAAERRVFAHQLDEQTMLVCLLTPAFASVLSAAICDDLFDAMLAAARATRGEASQRLGVAVAAANSLLFEHNLRTDVEHQALAGVGAVLWEQQQAHVVLLGPVCAVGLADGKPYQVHGLEDGRLASSLLDATRVAGLELGVASRSLCVPLAAQDALLLTADAPDINLRDLLATVVGTTLKDGLERWAALEQAPAEAALLSLTPPQDLRMPASTVSAHRVELLDVSAKGVVRDEPVESPIAEEPEARDQIRDEPLDEQLLAVAPDPVMAPTDAVAAEIDEVVEQELDIEPEAEADTAEPESLLPEPAAADDGFAFPWEEDDVQDAGPLPLAEDDEDEDGWASDGAMAEPAYGETRRDHRLHRTWEQLRSRFGGAARRVEEWTVGVLPDKLPERPKVTTKKETVALSGRALVLIAMAIPIVMLVFVIITRVQYDRAIEAQFDAMQLAAQDAYQMADAATDPAVQRQYLQEARLQAEHGLAMRPDDALLTTLKTRVEHDLDQINVVERIYTFYKLAEIDEYSASVSDSARLLLQDRDLYILHRGSDRVYHYRMNQVGDALEAVGTDPLLVQKGQVYDGAPAGELVDMTWITAGGLRGASAFAVLDRSGMLFVMGEDEPGITALPVANSQTWRQPKAMSSYFGNLYVLDTLLGSLLKYEPIDDAYTRAPASYIDTNLGVDLTGAVDLAVDGNMYILFADGHIEKYYDGLRQPFNSLSVPQPMLNPAAIFVSGDQEPDAEGYVYVADTGNERIVQFDKDGNYVRQIEAKIGGIELKDLRGLYVDEDTQRVLALSGRSLWLGTLPPL